MAYNAKIVEYPNGDIQLRCYSEPIRENFERKAKKEEEYFIEPWKNELVKVKIWKHEEPEDKIKREENNRYRSMVRSKNMIYTYARCCDWVWFITLTISPDSFDRYDFKLCSEKVRKWLKNQKNRYAPDLKYLIVPEQHADGAWHFHGLLADTGNIKFTFSGKRTKDEQRIYNLEKYNYGFTTATRVRDTSRVSKYIGKYVTKTLCDSTTGCMRYFVSHNIPTPKETTVGIESGKVMEFVQMLADSTGTQLTYISDKSEGAYNNVQYFELH